MDQAEYRSILLEAINRKGAPFHLDLLVEECAELIVAVNHYKRSRVGVGSLIEEMADAQIMLDTVRLILDEDVDFFGMITAKMERLNNRMAFKDGNGHKDPTSSVEVEPRAEMGDNRHAEASNGGRSLLQDDNTCGFDLLLSDRKRS